MSTPISKELIFNTTFGVEVEMTGITREAAARVAATVFGTGRVEFLGTYYQKWAAYDANGREWLFVSDASIRTTNGPATSTEMNTPPLTYAADMDLLQEVIRALRRAGAVSGVQYGCGIHVHVSGKGHTYKTIRNFINLMYSNDELIRKSLGVAEDRQRWCRPIEADLVESVKDLKSMEALERAWYTLYNGRFQGHDCTSREHYNDSRYHILNLHRFFSTMGQPSNTVEIRAFNACLHAGEIRAYVLLVLSMNASALTQKNIRAAKNPVMLAGNEKFAMRTWLNRMGWTGELFKNPHKLFTSRLNGDAAWRFGKNGDLYR